MQVKLLHVLQDRTIHRLGGSQEIPINVRFIAATNKPLRELVDAKQFREDLFYRLTELPILVPPLRERPEDILILADHFLAQHTVRHRKSITEYTEEAKEKLTAYP
ncbi:MAG: transcriptional regulator with PAS, ATPase and Fis domain [Candidatus Marinamargulisbacteria bacterium]|jgi:transcriptional regulator with PAS, ATPase and Fis domain